MQLVLLVLLIPLCSMGFFVYLNALMNYAFNNLIDVPLFSGGIVVSLILGFIIFHMFGNARVLSASKLNYEDKIVPYFSYYSFIILALFGLSLILNSIFNVMNIFIMGIGIFIILVYIYITFFYIFKYDTEVFILSSIDYYEEKSSGENQKNEDSELPKLKSRIKCLTFENEKIGLIEYYVEDGEFIPEKMYKVTYNPKLKLIKKVLNEVSVIE